MKSSLISREIIADSAELTVRGHCYDALVGIAGCDKSLPGLMMSMLRLNVPSVFIYGGSILPGKFKGKDVTVVDVFEAVGKHSSGTMSSDELRELELVACPSAGACGGQFTANTMACVSEAIGLALPYSAGTPAPYEERDKYAFDSGQTVMNLLEKNIKPRDIVTKKALENAATIVAATGGSTNAALHLPALANEVGIKFDLMDVAKIFKKTPYLADLKPGGKYVAKDMWEAGGVPMLLKTLYEGGYIHGECMTVTGKTMKENLANIKFNTNQKVLREYNNPLSPDGGVVGLKGNLAPEGAIVKIAGLKKLQFTGKARCFDNEEDAMKAVQTKKYKDGDVIIIRYEGPKGGPGMREMLSTTGAIYGQGKGEKVALITDGRFSGATSNKKIYVIDNKLFKNITSVSFDYSILEKAEDINIIKLKYSLSDLGSWKEILNIFYKKRNRYISNKNVFFRPWGKYTNLFKGENFLIKEIYVKSNAKLSLQKHFHRSEHWLIKKGLAHITLNNNIIIKKTDRSIFIPKGSIHRVENKSNKPLIIYEAQIGKILKESDIVRYDDIYGRVKSVS